MGVELINRQEFELARTQLGTNFVRILGYFREDGAKSVALVEEAMRQRNSAALVVPAHTLKGESRQFGSLALGDLAERIEMSARHCVEQRIEPEEILSDVAGLRECFNATLKMLEEESGSPLLASRQAARKAPAASLNGFTRS